MSGRQFTGDEGHYHQEAINADAAAREQEARIAAAQAAAEGSHYHQAAINEAQAQAVEATEATATPEQQTEVRFGALSQKAQTYLAVKRANARSGPGPFNNWTVLSPDALQVLRDGGFGSEVDELLGIETPQVQNEEAAAETDPAIAAFYDRLKAVRSFDELYGVLSRQDYVFETPTGDETWTRDDMIAFIRAVETGEQSINTIPDAWDEIKRAIERLLAEAQAATPETESEVPQESVVETPEQTEAPEESEEVVIDIPAPSEITLEDVPETPQASESAPATPEQLLASLASAREAYIREHRAYLDARRAGGLLHKIKAKFGGVKPEQEEDLPESLRLAKDDYDDAMRAYGISLSEMDLAEIPEAERTEAHELSARARAFQDVFCAEYGLTRRAQAETYPPAEKNLFVKGVEWWGKRNLLTKIGVTSGVVLFGTIAGAGGIAAGITAGLTGASFAAAAGGIFEKVSKVAKLDAMRDQNLSTVWNHLVETQPDTADAFSKAEMEARRVMSADEAKRRMREIKRTAVMLAAGVLGVGAAVGVRELLGHLTAKIGIAEAVPAADTTMPTEVSAADGAVPTDVGTTPSVEATAVPADGVTESATSGLRAEPIPHAEPVPGTGVEGVLPLEATTQQSGWFEALHNTAYNAASPLDQAKMTVIQKLSDAGIMGSINNNPVPSPLVDRVIQSVFGGAQSVEGWQAAARAVSDRAVIEGIKNAQQIAFANPSQNAVAEATIRALFTK